MMKFNTTEEAETANNLIAAEIKIRGQVHNPNYDCDKWSEIEEVVDGFLLPYTPIADDLNIDYETPDENAEKWYMVFNTQTAADQAIAVNGLTYQVTNNNKYIIESVPIEQAIGVTGKFTVERYDPKWF